MTVRMIQKTKFRQLQHFFRTAAARLGEVMASLKSEMYFDFGSNTNYIEDKVYGSISHVLFVLYYDGEKLPTYKDMFVIQACQFHKFTNLF